MDRHAIEREEPAADERQEPSARDFDVGPRTTLDLRLVTSLVGIAPDVNSRRNDPLRNDGTEPLFVIQDTSRRQDTPRDTLDAGAPGFDQPPPVVERVPDSGPEVPRDAEAVLHIVRMRLLSFDQLSRLTYFSAGISVARRRLRRLRDRGWIEIWERPVAQGGAPRYAYPTRRALLWASTINERVADSAPQLEKLIRLMSPATPRQPWKLEAGITPLFLPHTEETNEVLIAWLRRSGERMLWASSWDCPFPEHVEWRTMPQPDAVLVLEREGMPQLVFIEHDRNTESRQVIAKKFRVYREWGENPAIAERIFGFRSFHLLVTIAGERAERRRDQLAQLAREEGIDAFTACAVATPARMPSLPFFTMDFTHCRLCSRLVPLQAGVCPSCGTPTHQIARQELTVEESPPLIDYPSEIDAPETGTDPSAPPPHSPP